MNHEDIVTHGKGNINGTRDYLMNSITIAWVFETQFMHLPKGEILFLATACVLNPVVSGDFPTELALSF